MTDATNPSPDRREAYARVIDPNPDVWANYGPDEPRIVLARVAALREAALAKADQIIAMQAPAVGGEAIERAAKAICDYHWDGSQPWPNKPPSFLELYRGMARAALLAALPSTAVGGSQEAVRTLDAAFEAEIGKVSTLAFNSNSICREFYQHIRERFRQLHALAQPTPPSLVEENQELSASREPALAAPGRNAGDVPEHLPHCHKIRWPADACTCDRLVLGTRDTMGLPDDASTAIMMEAMERAEECDGRGAEYVAASILLEAAARVGIAP